MLRCIVASHVINTIKNVTQSLEGPENIAQTRGEDCHGRAYEECPCIRASTRRIARLVAWCVLIYLPSNAKLLLIKDLREKKERELSPNLSLQSSDHYMIRAGFSGIDVEVHDCDDNLQYSSSLSMSTASSVEQLYYSPEVVVSPSEAYREILWLGNISDAIEKLISKLPKLRAALEQMHGKNPVIF